MAMRSVQVQRPWSRKPGCWQEHSVYPADAFEVACRRPVRLNSPIPVSDEDIRRNCLPYASIIGKRVC